MKRERVCWTYRRVVEPRETDGNKSSDFYFIYVACRRRRVSYARPRSVRRRRPLSLTWKPTKMAEIVQMFLFLYKSKYRRKDDHQWRRQSYRDAEGDDRVAIATSDRQRQRWRCNGHGTDGAVARNVPWAPFLLWAALVCWVVHVSAAATTFSLSPTLDVCEACIYGDCINGTCVCRDGWQGANCEFCGGKVR